MLIQLHVTTNSQRINISNKTFYWDQILQKDYHYVKMKRDKHNRFFFHLGWIQCLPYSWAARNCCFCSEKERGWTKWNCWVTVKKTTKLLLAEGNVYFISYEQRHVLWHTCFFFFFCWQWKGVSFWNFPVGKIEQDMEAKRNNDRDNKAIFKRQKVYKANACYSLQKPIVSVRILEDKQN